MVRSGLLTMSNDGIDRLSVMQCVLKRGLTQERSSSQLAITTRQVRLLIERYRGDGAYGLVTRNRGGVGNRTTATQARDLILMVLLHKNIVTYRYLKSRQNQYYRLCC